MLQRIFPQEDNFEQEKIVKKFNYFIFDGNVYLLEDGVGLILVGNVMVNGDINVSDVIVGLDLLGHRGRTGVPNFSCWIQS